MERNNTPQNKKQTKNALYLLVCFGVIAIGLGIYLFLYLPQTESQQTESQQTESQQTVLVCLEKKYAQAFDTHDPNKPVKSLEGFVPLAVEFFKMIPRAYETYLQQDPLTLPQEKKFYKEVLDKVAQEQGKLLIGADAPSSDIINEKNMDEFLDAWMQYVLINAKSQSMSKEIFIRNMKSYYIGSRIILDTAQALRDFGYGTKETEGKEDTPYVAYEKQLTQLAQEGQIPGMNQEQTKLGSEKEQLFEKIKHTLFSPSYVAQLESTHTDNQLDFLSLINEENLNKAMNFAIDNEEWRQFVQNIAIANLKLAMCESIQNNKKPNQKQEDANINTIPTTSSGNNTAKKEHCGPDTTNQNESIPGNNTSTKNENINNTEKQ